jgi:hypothetical protein
MSIQFLKQNTFLTCSPQRFSKPTTLEHLEFKLGFRNQQKKLELRYNEIAN